jgi:hypothetical protein
MQGGRPGVTPSTEKVSVDIIPTEKRTLFAHVPKTTLMGGLTFIEGFDTIDARWTPGCHLWNR